MSAAWPIWNNENPLPGKPPRAWVPVVIQNPGHPVPGVSAPEASLFDNSTPRRRLWPLGGLASLLVHAAALAAGILLFLPADDPFDIEGSAVEVEIISTQTVASNEVSEVQSDASQSMVSAGSEVIEATETETLDPVEPEETVPPETAKPVETETVEALQPPPPAETAEPVEATVAESVPLLASVAIEPEPLETVQPETPVPAEPVETVAAIQPQQAEAKPVEPTETIEASEPVDPNAPPVPQKRTVAQRQEPTYPKPEPRQETPKKPQKPKPSAGGNGGNSNADAKAGAPAAGQQGTGAQGNNAAVTKYPGQVLSKLRRALRYPSGARGAGEVQVQFTVSAGGSASGIRVVASSGNPVFDNAAVETVRRAAPFPAIPAEAGRDSWTFTMPLGFVR